MKETLPNEARNTSGNPAEKEPLELSRLEICALTTAFEKRPESMEKILNTEIAIKSTNGNSLMHKAIRSLEHNRIDITPELAALYINVAMEERAVLTKRKETDRFAEQKNMCEHTAADHIKALDE